jgi:hypothetical protein
VVEAIDPERLTRAWSNKAMESAPTERRGKSQRPIGRRIEARQTRRVRTCHGRGIGSDPQTLPLQ